MKLNNISSWEDVYANNRRLDDIFIQKYESQEPEYVKKNCIEFLVELGEFVNETKCFKYWSIKEPKKEAVLEEFADCITMIFYFYGILNIDKISLDETKKYPNNSILEIINYLYYEGTKLFSNLNEDLIKGIFTNLIYLSQLLELNEEEILQSINKKQLIIEERLNSNY